jgi:preprotein translocase subunit YajC
VIYSFLSILGQGNGAASPPAPSGGGADPVLWIGLILMLTVYMVIVLGGNRKEKKKRQDMLASVGKNDRVMTIGGIIGTVVSIKDNEVLLKVDESSNVKITVIRSAIQKVLAEGEKPVDV